MKKSIEEAIDRLEYVNRSYDCNNYYRRYDLDCIEILLSDYKRVLKENEHKTEKIENQKSELAILNDYQELQDNYIKKYDEINEGLQAMINVLQELIEEREEK